MRIAILQQGDRHHRDVEIRPYPPSPLRKHGLVEAQGGRLNRCFLGIFETTVFGVPDVRLGLKPFYRTLPPDAICFEVILSHS